ncbi:hypothetical protein BMS3Abin01_01143 [bacterium BMS3Abin01]|nr:hypothetical protein BMS3Abin01_01143 [bacterium BMS3Abin01]
MDSMMALDVDLRQREATDWQTTFISAFLLTIITCGIYGIYILYKLMDRRLQHFERLVSLREHLIEVLREKAAAAGKTAEVEEDLSQLEGLHLEATARDRAGEKSPVLWLVLTIVFSLVVYYIYYFLNDDFRAHEANEQQFMAKASDIMTKLGIVQQPITPSMVVPERTFVKYLLLTIFTCGIYGIYWWYTLITDPNLHFDNHATWETQLSTALSSS